MNRFKITLAAGLIALFSLSWLSTVEAAITYVDKGSPCPGTGTSTSPYCSIQRAFSAATAGTTIRIRNSSNPYDENAVATISGTATSPIIVEPDVGHNPKLRFTGNNAQTGAIEIRDADYWQIRGLTFDGSGIQTSRYAIYVYANTRDVMGHQIVNNIFQNWGGTGENTKGADAIGLRPSSSSTGYNPYWIKNAVISDNTFNSNAQGNIHITQTSNTVVERNTIRNTLCGRKPNDTVGATGIKISQGSVGAIIRNNIVRDFQNSDNCLFDNQGNAIYVGIYCDTGPIKGQVSGNIVYNIDKGKSSSTNTRGTGVNSVGIFMESRCSDWKVTNNVVYNIGTYGFRNGSPSTGDPDRTQWTNNTVFNIARTAMWVPRGNNLVIKNNILGHNQGNAAVELASTAIGQGPHTISYNLYWDMSTGSKVGRWGDYSTRDLPTWKSACTCDSPSNSKNPLFVSLTAGSEDFHLTASSPARGTGENGTDIGAYPYSTVLAAPVAPTQLLLK
jgi:Right handed beta helix region